MGRRRTTLVWVRILEGDQPLKGGMVALTVIEGGGSDDFVDELQWPESPDEPLHVRLNRLRSNAVALDRGRVPRDAASVVLDRPAHRFAPSAGKHQLGQLTQEGRN
jgi:hypothetical protein